MDEIKRILEILEGECECGISVPSELFLQVQEDSSPFLDEMVQSQYGLRILEILRQSPFLSPYSSSQLLGERLVLSELVEKWLVEQVLDIFGVVEGSGSCRAFVGFLLMEGVSRVDS